MPVESLPQAVVFPQAADDWAEACNRQAIKGQAKYGTPLTTHNGLDAGQMCLEELVDAQVYLTQLRMEFRFLTQQYIIVATENLKLRQEVRRLEGDLKSSQELILDELVCDTQDMCSYQEKSESMSFWRRWRNRVTARIKALRRKRS